MFWSKCPSTTQKTCKIRVCETTWNCCIKEIISQGGNVIQLNCYHRIKPRRKTHQWQLACCHNQKLVIKLILVGWPLVVRTPGVMNIQEAWPALWWTEQFGRCRCGPYSDSLPYLDSVFRFWRDFRIEMYLSNNAGDCLWSQVKGEMCSSRVTQCGWLCLWSQDVGQMCPSWQSDKAGDFATVS